MTHPDPLPALRASAATIEIAVVVVTYHTGPILRDCLGALLADPAIGRIVVVDNGNPEADSAWLAARTRGSPRMRLLAGHGNIGFAAGCNRGAAIADAQTLIFLNPDAVIAPGAATALAEALRTSNARPCLVGGRVVGPDGRAARGCRRERVTPWRAIISFSGLSRLEKYVPALRDIHRERDPEPTAPAPVPAISGAFMAMRADDFDALGGLDEGYFLHVEDLDLCRRVEAAGGQVLFHPGASARHARSTSRASRVFVERCKARGFTRYFRKFARGPMERVGVELLAPMIGAALIAKALLAPKRPRHGDSAA